MLFASLKVVNGVRLVLLEDGLLQTEPCLGDDLANVGLLQGHPQQVVQHFLHSLATPKHTQNLISTPKVYSLLYANGSYTWLNTYTFLSSHKQKSDMVHTHVPVVVK